MIMVVLLQLLLAHLLTDFVIQTDEWVGKKQENGLASYHFWLHIFPRFSYIHSPAAVDKLGNSPVYYGNTRDYRFWKTQTWE